jgi:hypothetical protein
MVKVTDASDAVISESRYDTVSPACLAGTASLTGVAWSRFCVTMLS